MNEIRAAHPALTQLRNFTAQWSDDDSILVFSKYLAAEHSPTGIDDAIIVVANLDPHSVRQSTVHLDPSLFGVDPELSFDVTDLISGDTFTWGQHNFVRLDAFTEPVHILRVEFPKGS